MTLLLLLLLLLFLQSAVTAGRAAAGCQGLQTQMDGRCCDLCPPGTYMKEFCSDKSQSVCEKCDTGSFSQNHTIFDRCEPCRVCQQGHAARCSPTTNAKCLCHDGFQCSDHVCSRCEKELQCIVGERVERTGSTEYSYKCKPACSGDEYWDVRANVCRSFTQCHKVGLVERFPGNRSHDAVCDRLAEPHGGGGVLHVAFVSCFILFSLAFLASLSYFCTSVYRKHKAAPGVKAVESPAAANACTCEYHLSKEETGLQLIIQDASKSQPETCTTY